MRYSRIGKVAVATVIMMLGGASAAKASTVFGTWEDSAPDGWGSGNNGQTTFASTPSTVATYSYGPYGATNGSVALQVTLPTGNANYIAALGNDLQANGLASTFLADDVLSFDVTFAPSNGTASGLDQIIQLTLNSGTGGYHNLPVTASQGYYPSYAGSTTHVSVNYDAYKAPMGGSTGGYLQLGVTFQDYGGAPPTFSIDNFALTAIPEPASVSMLGLGAAGLLSRRRRR